MSLYLGDSKITPTRTAEIIALSQEIMMLSKENTELKNNGLIGVREGEYIDITDSAEARFSHKNSDGLVIEGNSSKQETTTGVQLFDIFSRLFTNQFGLQNVYNDDGSVTTTGVPDRNYAPITQALQLNDILEDNTEYTISQKEANSYLFLQINEVSKETPSTANYYSLINRTKLSFTPDKSTYNYQIVVQTGTTESWGTSSKTITNSYMLSKGTATDFEPYTGGQASPNPNYPQEIHSVGDNVNLFDGIYEKTYTGGSEPYIYSPSESTRTAIIKVKPNTTYTISKELSNRFRMSQYTEKPVIDISRAISYIYPQNEATLTSYTLTTESITQYLAIQVTNESQENVKMQVKQRYSRNTIFTIWTKMY